LVKKPRIPHDAGIEEVLRRSKYHLPKNGP
jgi:hypothetical protein